MKVGIMQPYFLPYIGYWQLINAVDKYVIYDDVQFIKGGWINRNNILINGQKQLFNLLLLGASSNKLINEIIVQKNQTKLIRTIELNYKKAPMFQQVFPFFLQIMEHSDKNLAKFIGNSIVEISKYLFIETEFIYSSTLDKDNILRAEDKVLDICKLLNATKYINAVGGVDLYSKESFSNNGIQLSFLEPKILPYEQLHSEFVPYLSIIDILMFNSQVKAKTMLDNYRLL